MFNPFYTKQVKLLLSTLPLLKKHDCFALKGGTAMNLFVQNLPRLSVDIDLAYLPIVPRDEALTQISNELELLAEEIENEQAQATVTKQPMAGVTGKLIVNAPDAQIKIEPNFVFRGALHPTETRMLCPAAQEEFELFAEGRVVSIADLYGGKICAALDRQHPRDLFDVHLMFEQFGLTDEIRTAFVVYLAGHPRPMAELLNPNEQPLDELYHSQFAGMTREPVSLETLIDVHRRLVQEVNDGLTEQERHFLLSIKTGTPEWSCLPIEHLDKLPALQWKLRNVGKMSAEKHQQAIDALKQVLKL
jgi:predicted nucleotidyltransferase component of viral defense system